MSTKHKILSDLIKRIPIFKTRNYPIFIYPSQCSKELSRAGSTKCEEDNHPVKNKVALITGGARGIGLEFAIALLRNKAKGVMLADLEEEEGKKAICLLTNNFGPGKVGFIKTNVMYEDEYENAFKSTLDIFNQIDIVINNAGVFNEGEWDQSLDINCGGVTRGTLLGFKYMGKGGDECGEKKKKGGTIVNVSSLFALLTLASCPIHTAQEAYILALSRTFGRPYHCCNTGVKVLTLCPGVTLTPMSRKHIDRPATEYFEKELATFKSQPVQNVGNALICLLFRGESGSVWISENCEPVYKIEFPSVPAKSACK